MPTDKQTRTPSYRLHKGSGLGVVTLNGKDHYLGQHGTEASRAQYSRLILTWLEAGRRLPDAEDGSYTIAHLCDGFLDWCEREYRAQDGSVSREVKNVKLALRALLRLFFDLPAKDFGPRYLILYRQQMIGTDLTRNTINQRVAIVKRAFCWASSEERVPPSTYHGLACVKELKRGRAGGVRENEPTKPVPDRDIEAATEFMSPTIRAMVEFQLLTGARPGEVVILRLKDIDRSDPDIWEYRPTQHKNSHRRLERVIYIGKRAQSLLIPFFRPGLQEKYLFSPKQAENERRALAREARKTPLWPSHVRAQKLKQVRAPRRAPGEKYQTQSYAQAVRRACRLAEVDVWTPGKLRHNAATRIRNEFGIEAARMILGHKSASTTEIYSSQSKKLAKSVVAGCMLH